MKKVLMLFVFLICVGGFVNADICKNFEISSGESFSYGNYSVEPVLYIGYNVEPYVRFIIDSHTINDNVYIGESVEYQGLDVKVVSVDESNMNLQACVDGEEIISTCTDSDGGMNYYKKGEVFDNNPSGVLELDHIDYCEGNILDEGFCYNGITGSTMYDCSSEGKVCKEGVCVADIKSNYLIEEDIGEFRFKSFDFWGSDFYEIDNCEFFEDVGYESLKNGDSCILEFGNYLANVDDSVDVFVEKHLYEVSNNAFEAYLASFSEESFGETYSTEVVDSNNVIVFIEEQNLAVVWRSQGKFIVGIVFEDFNDAAIDETEFIEAYLEKYSSDLSGYEYICTDTDEGMNYYLKGYTKGYDFGYQQINNLEDHCVNETILWEYWCGIDQGNRWNYAWKEYDCSSDGMVCIDGACILDSNVDCISEYKCTKYPTKCPESEIQTRVCIDNVCGKSYEEEIECDYDNDCSGCLFDSICVPFGNRLDNKDISSSPVYCDIDGEFRNQKTVDSDGNWASCQNDYECESNVCSSGECVEIANILQQANVFKKIGGQILCRFSQMFGVEGYEQCLYKFLGE